MIILSFSLGWLWIHRIGVGGEPALTALCLIYAEEGLAGIYSLERV